jgi:hypothetical protein
MTLAALPPTPRTNGAQEVGCAADRGLLLWGEPVKFVLMVVTAMTVTAC